MAVLPDNYHGFRSAEMALGDVLAVARSPGEFDAVRLRISPDEGPGMTGTATLSARTASTGAIAFLLDEQPVVTIDGRDVRGGWLAVNDAVDISFGIDFTTGRLHIADGVGMSPTPLQSTGTGASRRVARQGVREWPAVLHDIATLARKPRERPEHAVSVVVDRDPHGVPRRLLRDADDPSEVSLFVGDSERLRLSRMAFRGAWLSDDDNHDSYLDVDSSGGRPDGNLAFTHQISSVWGVH